MIKQSLPAVTEVTHVNHDEFKKADRVVVIAYVNKASDEPAPQFNIAAEQHRDDYLFGLTTDHAAMDIEGVTPPAIVIYRSFDEPKSVYPYPVFGTTSKDIADWVKEMAIPTVDEVTVDNYSLYAASGKPLAYLFIDPSSEHKQDHINAVKPVAAEFKTKLNFVYIDAIKFGDHAKALNLPEPKWPSFVIQDLNSQLKYPYPQSQEVTTQDIYAMVEKYVAGQLAPELKSQPIPETHEGNVHVVVGKTFDEIIYDDSKDIFIEFYASWCGHCKRLAPIWEQLGDKYAHADHLIVAKMEAQENDLPPSAPFRVTGFPTIKFKKAGTRDFVEYEGDRSLESLIAFAEEHSTLSLEVPVGHDDHAQVHLGEDHHEHEHEHEYEHDEHDEL
jgi:protein disulfide-isomerase A1